MAYTRIHAIKATVHKAVKYICNPEKTDENILVSSFGCSPETARFDFKYELSKTRQSDANLAFHMIQSCAPGEVSYEEAHRIGVEFADKVLQGHYSYIVATHIDKGHVHNHIVFCAADHISHQKYHDCKQSYKRIRSISDEICKEHDLSVIVPGQTKGKSYTEWLTDKNGPSWKTRLKNDINKTINSANSYEEFIAMMRAKGYQIKGESLESAAPKYITFQPPGVEHCVRGRSSSLGEEYTKEKISERIGSKTKHHIPFPRNTPQKSLIDTSQEKFIENKGLKKWADLQNLKLVAKNYADIQEMRSLSDNLSEKKQAAKTARNTVVDMEHSMKDLSELIRYGTQYTENRPYQLRYSKSKNPEQYLQRHESQLLLYSGAEAILLRHKITPAKVNLSKLREDYNQLSAQRNEVTKSYKIKEKEIREIEQKLQNLKEYIGSDGPELNADQSRQNGKFL